MQKSSLERSAAVAGGAYSSNTARTTQFSSCIHATDQWRDHGENLPYSWINALIIHYIKVNWDVSWQQDILSDAQFAFKKHFLLLLEKETTQNECSWSSGSSGKDSSPAHLTRGFSPCSLIYVLLSQGATAKLLQKFPMDPMRSKGSNGLHRCCTVSLGSPTTCPARPLQ